MYTWHIWEEPHPPSLELLASKISNDPTNSLLICSAEESYENPKILIERIFPGEEEWLDDFGNFEQFSKNLSKLKSVDIIIGTPDTKVVEQYNKIGNVQVWDTFFLFRSYANLKTKIDQQADINKVFMSLNTKAHYHRCMMIDRLHQHNLLDKGLFSWHNIPSYSSTIPQYQWTSWDPQIVSFDQNYSVTDGNHLKMQHAIPKESNQCFKFLVNETCTNRLFITEKTWHAILVGKPFLVFASPNFHKYLEDLGFELYDEIFDYTFDNIIDESERCNSIINEIEKISNLNLNNLNTQVKEKVRYNQNKAYEIIKNQIGVPKIAKEFEVYNKLLLSVEEKIKNERSI